MSINQHIILFDLETELDAQSPGPFKNNDKKQKRWLVESLKSLFVVYHSVRSKKKTNKKKKR